MKKQLLFLMLVLMLPVMVACVKEDNPVENGTVGLSYIEGTWMCVKSVDSYQIKDIKINKLKSIQL